MSTGGGNTHIFSADKLTAGDITTTTVYSEDSYFTINADADNKYTVDTGKKKFTVGDETVEITNRLKSNKVTNSDKRNIQFTVAEGKTADVTVCVLSSNGTTGTEIALYKGGNAVKTQALEGSGNYSNPITPVTWTDVGSGTFYIGNTGNESLKAANFFYIVVEERTTTTQHIFNADKLTAGDITATTVYSEDSYFTINADADNKYTVDTGKKKFTVGEETVEITNRLKSNKVTNSDKRNIQFTVAEGMTADVTVCVLSSNGTTGTEIALYQNGSAVKTQALEGSGSYSNPITPITWTNVGSGTFYIGNTGNESLKAANFFYIVVTEKVPGATVTPPSVSSVTAIDNNGVVTVSVAGTAGGTNSLYKVEARKGTDGEWASAGTADGAAASGIVTVDLSGDKYGTGEWYFRACGTGEGSADSASVECTTSVSYILPLGKATPSVAVGDAKATITWGSVREANSYIVSLYDSETGTTAIDSKTVASTDNLKAEFTGLTNGKKYWVAIQADRTSPAAITVSDRVAFRPYATVDTSNAIPGMTLVDQSEDAKMVVLRENGNITISQPASSGGVATKARTNISFIQYPEAVTGDFSISADVTIQTVGYASNNGGVFLGGFTSTGSDMKLGSSALRGAGNIKAYREKPNDGGGSATDMSDASSNKITSWEVGKTYTLKVERSGEDYVISINDGSKTYSKTYNKTKDSASNIEPALYDAVYPAIAIAGVTVDLQNIVVTVGGVEKFNSATLTGSVSPFADNWAEADTPVIKSTTVDNANQKITVKVDGEVGVTGASQIAVEMYDAAGKLAGTEIASAFGQTSHELTFEPEASGDYTFKAIASRTGETTVKNSNTMSANGFVLKLAGTTPSASNQGGGAVKINWTTIKEATGYNVYYKTANSSYTLGASNVSGLTTTISGLTNGATYTFKVLPVRGSEEGTVESTVEKTVKDEFEPDWFFSAFGGSSISTSKNGYEGSANDGSVRVWSNGNGGKLVPADVDQVAFYYTEVPADKNFTLTAKATVNSWTYTNGQEGFGLMAADDVAPHGDKTMFWNNSYMAFASKVEYYWDDAKQAVSDAGTKISMKMGLGSQEKTGVTPENLAEFNSANQSAAMTAYYNASVRPLESSCGVKGTGTYNIIANGANATGTVENPLTEVTFTIQKNNTGYFVSYTDANGNVTTNKYYDTKALEHLDEDTVYAGVFTARSCDVTFTDIKLTLIDPADDLPAEERPVTSVTPSYRVISATNANSKQYDLVFLANADGLLTIKDEAGTAIVANKAVTNNVKVTVPTTIGEGTTKFNVTFVPNKNYKPSEYEVLGSYETATFSHSVTYKPYDSKVLYVAPDGKSSGDGTRENPIDIYTAVKYVQAGQYIVLRGGTYSLTSTVKVERGIDGTASNMIYMVADPQDSERPVFDFNKACAGMIFAGDYWYCQGFDVTNSSNGQKGLQISGSYSTFDDIHAYHNGNTGIQVSRYLSSDNWEDWPSYDLILNCTSYGNADAGYEDADGFAAKLTVADGIVFDGCVAYNNADDGWDLFAKPETGPIGNVTIKNSVTYANGYLEDGTNAGNGNGFKMGGSAIAGQHKLINSIAFNNKAKGIDSNSGPDIQAERSTTYNNGSYNVAFYTSGSASTNFVANGVLSYRTENLSMAEQIKAQGTQDMNKIYGVSNYYWNVDDGLSVNTEGRSVADNWFKSLDFVGITRNADGTINMNGFLELTDAAPAGVGAVMTGTPSKVIQIPTEVEEEEDDDDEEETSTPETPQTVAPVSPSTPKPVTKTVAGEVVVKKLIINQDADWKEVNNALVDLLKEVGDNKGTLEVELGKHLVLSVDVTDAIKGKDITLQLKQGNGVVWEINGKDVENPVNANMEVVLDGKAIPEEELAVFADLGEVRQFSVSHEGEFGFLANMKYPVGAKNNGKNANLFYYNEGVYEFICSSKILEGYAEFPFSHASDYVVVISDSVIKSVPEVKTEAEAEKPATQPQENATDKNAEIVGAGVTVGAEAATSGNILSIVLIILVVVVAVGVVGFMVLRKKSNEE